MTNTEPKNSIPFATFWSWLKRHTGCILRVGTPDIYVSDHDCFHWIVDEDADGNPNVFLFFGKTLISELMLEARDIQFVQLLSAKDPENPEHSLFQIIGGQDGEEPYPLVMFLMEHGIEEEPSENLTRTYKH